MIQYLMRMLTARFETTTSQQLTAPKLRAVIWITVGLLWMPFAATLWLVPGVVRAQALQAGFEVPGLVLAVSLFLSTLAGITALLIRVERELSAAPEKPLPRPWLFSAAHMSGSWLAGALAFLINQAQEFNVWYGLALVIAMSFVGAKAVEMWAERALPGSTKTGRAGGEAS